MFAGFIAGCVVGAIIGMVVTLVAIIYFSGVHKVDLSRPHDDYD